jgi:uroporphyrinogen decarboxylase
VVSIETFALSPAFFDKYVAPYAKKLIDQMKKFGLYVTIHSCGAISDLIPRLIDLGIDCLHPLQAKAAGMEPEKLAKNFGRDIVFMGGVDTQELLINAKPQEIKNEVYRLKELLGPNYIISPSHECILPNVPLENIIAMAEAAKE